MDFFELVRRRRSVRAFRPEAPPPDALERMLEAMRRAPSAGNLQAYQLVVVRDAEGRNALSHAAFDQDFVAEAPIVLAFLADAGRSKERYGVRGELFALQDATIAATYAQLAALALGYASAWVGAFDEAAVRRILRVPTSLRPICLLAVGYAAEEPPLTSRRPLRETVHVEHLPKS